MDPFFLLPPGSGSESWFAPLKIQVITVITFAFWFEHVVLTVVSNHFPSVSPGEGDEDEAGSEWPLQALFAEFSSSAMEDTWKTWDNLWKRCGKL